MSSLFSSFGGAPTSFCQHCRNPLPPNIIQCGYCGYDNSPVQRNDLAGDAPLSSQTPWNVYPLQNGNIPPNQHNNGQIFQNENAANQYNNAKWLQNGYSPDQNSHSQWGSMSSSQPSSATNSFVQPGSGQRYPGSPANAFPSAQLGGNGGLDGISGQFPGFGDNQSTSVPPAFYNAFPDYGQVNNALSPAFMTLPQTPEIPPSTTEERRTLNMKKVVGLVVILLVLIGGSIAGGYRLLTSLRQANNITSVPSSYPIPKGTPLFAETFMNNSKQWDMQSMQGRYVVSIKKGNLILEDDDNKLFPVLLPSGKNFSDFKLIVDATLSKGDRQNGYGLCIRGTTDSHGYLTVYYRIELYGSGAYAVFKIATDTNGNTNTTTLVQPTANAAIKPAGRSNQIVVIANGLKITLVVNGQIVQTFSDTSYTSGVVALLVSNVPDAHPGAQATFSHLAIYPVNAK